MKKIFSLLIIVISLMSCNKDVSDITDFMLTGDATQQLSDTNIKHFENRQSICGEKLHIQINNTCKQGKYLHQIDQLYGTINICVYINPRIIKAETYGLGSVILHGEYLNQYFKIQQNYANGQSVEKAIDDMINLCLSANEHAKTEKGFFKRFATNPISIIFGDAYDFITNIFVPNDNFLGKIVSPFYKIACWSLNKTQSLTNGLNMIILLMFCISLTLLCSHLNFIKIKRKNLIGIDLIRIIIELGFLLIIIFYTIYLSTPKQEILYALNVYNIDVKNIELAFNNYNFKPTSLFLIIITSVTFIAVGIISIYNNFKNLERKNISYEKIEEEISSQSDKLGEKIGTRALSIILFLFLDRSILFGLFMYFLLRLIINFIILYKPLLRFLMNRGITMACIIIIITLTGCSLLSNTNNKNKTQGVEYTYNSTFRQTHLDSINYLIAKDMYQMTKDISRRKWKNLNIEQIQKGWNDYYNSQYITSKEFSTNLNQNLYICGQVTSFNDKSALQGVTVNVKGKKKGTITDNDGKYSIYARPNDTIECMYLGYHTRYIPIKGASTINITMNNTAFFEDILAFQKFDSRIYNEYVKNGNFKNGLSYMIGAQLARKYYHNGITDILNLQDIYNIATTFHKGKTYKYSYEDEIKLIKHHQSITFPIIYEKNQNIAHLFLKENAKRSNVIKTKSGLQLYVINKGKGRKPHAIKSSVTIRYTGYKLNGKVFDKQEEPMTFKCSSIINGLSEALTYIAPGGKLIAYIPSNLAYKNKNIGNIFPGEMLIFEIELISVKN